MGKLWATTTDNRLWSRDPVLSNVNWQLFGNANNVRGLAAANGYLFAATTDNRLWVRDPRFPETDWQPIGHANNVTTMTSAPTAEACLN